MSTLLTEPARGVGELHLNELHFTRRQLGALAWQRSTVGFSPAEQAEYGQLVTREEELLGPRRLRS